MSSVANFIAGLSVMAAANALAADPPLYKPSSRSPEPIDITSNAYGANSLAPTAINIADRAPDFDLPVSGGGNYRLSAADKPVAIVFYRGHW